jgi:hypothetical protein
MTECTTQLQTLEPGTTSCTYHISVENDPDNWWYSPFGETGVSGAYKLTAPDAAATGEGTGEGAGTAVTRASAYERGSYFDAFSDGTGIECSDNSNFNWSLTGQPDQQGMCIDVVAGSSSMRAQTQSSTLLNRAGCSNTATQRWITRATAFSPSNVAPGTHTNYVLEGCAQDCTTPSDLATKNMSEVSDSSDSLSYKNFDKNIQCLAGFNAPDVGASGLPANVQDYLSTGVGVPARVCDQPGTPYVVGSGCTANCSFGDRSMLGDRVGRHMYPGYNLAGWEVAVNSNPEALASFGVNHWSSEISGPLLTCNDGYTRTESNAFLGGCPVPGDQVIIGSGDDTGCIADCRPDPDSEAKIYSNTGASTDALGPLIIVGPGSTIALESFPYPGSDTPPLFTCPPDYEPGPGAMPSDANGETVHSTPRYEHCGKLPGAYDDQWLVATSYNIDTRNNYAVTGCYPTCDRETEICLNYTAREPITDATRQTADSWRDVMGAALAAADPMLSPNNISYVRTQVLNNSDVVPDAQLVPEQIYEWQFKCSKEICSMTADGTKINLTALLGPDGIPTAQEVPVETWIIGEQGGSCDTVCQAINGQCATDQWVQDITSTTWGTYLEMAESGAECHDIRSSGEYTAGLQLLLSDATHQSYDCSLGAGMACATAPDTRYKQNLCKCTVAPTGPATVASTYSVTPDHSCGTTTDPFVSGSISDAQAACDATECQGFTIRDNNNATSYILYPSITAQLTSNIFRNSRGAGVYSCHQKNGVDVAPPVVAGTPNTYSVTPGSCVADPVPAGVGAGSISDAQDACNRDNECPGFTYFDQSQSYLLQTNITGTEASDDNSCYQKS